MLVPVVVALVVLANVLGGSSPAPGDQPVASASGGPSGGVSRPGTPLAVTAPPVSEQARDSCPALLAALPSTLDGESTRPVTSDSPYVRAWGDPAVVLVCGAERPAGLQPTSALVVIDGVSYYVDTSSKDAVVWTAVDRPVYVQVRLPASADSSSVTELTPRISAALPQTTAAPPS